LPWKVKCRLKPSQGGPVQLPPPPPESGLDVLVNNDVVTQNGRGTHRMKIGDKEYSRGRDFLQDDAAGASGRRLTHINRPNCKLRFGARAARHLESTRTPHRHLTRRRDLGMANASPGAVQLRRWWMTRLAPRLRRFTCSRSISRSHFFHPSLAPGLPLREAP